MNSETRRDYQCRIALEQRRGELADGRILTDFVANEI
jgi:hypothetical protein